MCSSRKDDRREGGEKTRKRDSSKKDRNIVCKDKEPSLQQIAILGVLHTIKELNKNIASLVAQTVKNLPAMQETRV